MVKNVAFIGYPNVGKTTIINYVTKANLQVANYAGVTVDYKCVKHKVNSITYNLVDLPGIHDLDYATNEELVTTKYLKDNKIDLIINVIDAFKLKEQLRLTKQLAKLKIPMLIIVNNMGNNKVSVKLDNITNIKTLYFKKTRYFKTTFNNSLKQFYYNYYVNDDMLLHNKMKVNKIDKLLLNRYFGVVIMLLILFCMMMLLFSISSPIQVIFEDVIYKISIPITNYLRNTNLIVMNFFTGAVVTPIATLFSFIPLLGILYFLIGLLEESGYMARMSVLMDRIMSKFNLDGRTFLNFLIGFGCSVPAIYSLRTIENKLQRKLCCLLIPFMSCAAKLPVYLFLCNYFFKQQQLLVVILLYVMGIVVALLFATLFSKIVDINKLVNIIELPSYKVPNIRVTLKKSFVQVKNYIKKTFTIVLFTTMIVWGLSYFPDGNYSNSYMNSFVNKIDIFFEPTGFGDCKPCISALPAGVIAKEGIISVLSTYDENEYFSSDISDELIRLKMFCYLVFILLMVPCIMSISAIYKEYGIKLCVLSLGINIIVPYLISSILYLLRFMI